MARDTDQLLLLAMQVLIGCGALFATPSRHPASTGASPSEPQSRYQVGIRVPGPDLVPWIYSAGLGLALVALRWSATDGSMVGWPWLRAGAGDGQAAAVVQLLPGLGSHAGAWRRAGAVVSGGGDSKVELGWALAGC